MSTLISPLYVWAWLVLVKVFHTDAASSNGTSVLDPSQYFGTNNGTSYNSWVNSHLDTYNNTFFLSSVHNASEGLALFWNIDETSATINLAVAAKATNWVGIGLSEAGGMPGADVAYFTAATKELVDAYVGDGYIQPTTDDNSQDWTLLNSTVDGGFIIFEAQRKLDTGDSQDRVIRNDSNLNVPDTRLIGAWGDNDFGYHGLNVARSSVQLFRPTDGKTDQVFATIMAERSDGFIDVGAVNFSIPLTRTYYYERCSTLNELAAQGMPTSTELYLIGFEALVPTETKKYVHHLIVYGFENKTACDDNSMEAVYVWAPGVDSEYFPNDTGIALGAADGGYNSFLLQIHYDNIDLESAVDNTTVRMYYTANQVTNNVGVLSIGDPFVYLVGQEIGVGLTRHEMTCPDSCTNSSFDSTDNVTVIREALHMHAKGKRIVNQQLRNETVVRQATLEYWDFDQNGFPSIQQEPYILKRGDGFRTTCYYDGSAGDVFGFGSNEEMCMSFLWYYPKQNFLLGVCGVDFELPYCNASSTFKSLNNVSDLNRSFGMTLASDPASTVPTSSPVGNSNVDTATPTSSGKTSYSDMFPHLVSASLALIWFLA